jgi:hypothetical protein
MQSAKAPEDGTVVNQLTGYGKIPFMADAG